MHRKKYLLFTIVILIAFLLTACRSNESKATLKEKINNNDRIACGIDYSFALKNDGTVWGWGANSQNQLGDNTWVDQSKPVKIDGLDEIVSISSGLWINAALKKDGTVWLWGARNVQVNNEQGERIPEKPKQEKYISNVAAIKSGGFHIVALKKDGTVWCWGFNEKGQIGSESKTDQYVSDPTFVEGLENIVSIAAGSFHSLALKDDGSVWVWGHNKAGMLTGNPKENREIIRKPIKVEGLPKIVKISTKGYHNIAVDEAGDTWVWGDNEFGQLGTKTKGDNDVNTTDSYIPIPKKIDVQYKIKSIFPGRYCCLAIKDDNSLIGWGSNTKIQYAGGIMNSVAIVDSDMPVSVKGLTNVIEASVGYHHALILKDDGSLWTWGKNLNGQLGNGKNIDISEPVKIEGINMF